MNQFLTELGQKRLQRGDRAEVALFKGLSWRARIVLPLAALFAVIMGGLILLFMTGLGGALAAVPAGDRLVATAGLGTRLVLLSLVGLAILVALAPVIIDRQVKAPADRLLKAFKRAAQGDLPEPLHVVSQDEFGGLVDGFNQLLASLRQQRTMAAEIHRSLETELNTALAEGVTDPLTGVINRRFFKLRLAEEVARSLRYNHTMSLVLVDVDRFAAVNQEHGRESGDRTLAELAAVIKESVRACDIVARCGGEEFAILIPETDASGAHFLARRLRQKISDHPAWGKGRALPSLTVSMGIASLPQDSRTADEIFERAWQSVLYAKEMGRNQVRHYGEVVAAGFVPPGLPG